MFGLHHAKKQNSARLAAAITRAASTQTYYTILLLADRDRVSDAYRAYAYFRWVDDILDAETGSKTEKQAFIERQQKIMEACYFGDVPGDVSAEEQMLVDLIQNDWESYSGLRAYLDNMMAVMRFDVERRGRLASKLELSRYSRSLATAITEALHYFIGHDDRPARTEARYQSVYGAHVVHMLRDAIEDTAVGYYNIPRETVDAHQLNLQDVDHPAYQAWVAARARLAQKYLKNGRNYIAQVKCLRCRLAGFAYTARFEWMLRVIEQDGYRLRTNYPERKSLQAGLWMAWSTLASALNLPKAQLAPAKVNR